jgi:hypothetical protein
MIVTSKEILDLILDNRATRTTDGTRLTIRKETEENIRYIEIFMWESHMPDENHFSSTTMVDSDIDLPSVVDALNTVSVNCIAASLVSVDSLYNLTSPKPLTRLTEALAGIQVQKLWTKNISWKFFQGLFPSRAPQSWQSMTDVTLDLLIDTLEDQACCIDVFSKGNLRRVLAQLGMLRHISLSFYSELPSCDILCSHAPFEQILETQSAWPHLKSLHLDSFDGTAQELLSFLEAHKSTLKGLTLRNHFLLSGSWMQLLPEVRELLNLKQAEIAGAIESCNELWLVKIPELQDNCFLAEDLSYWLTHPRANLSCPLSKRNLVRKGDPQEEDWE